MAGVDRVAPACRFIDLRRCGPLSRAVFVNFELSENAIPSVVEVEDRHVEHEQWIAHAPAALEHFSPFVRETSFHSRSCCSGNGSPFILAAKFIRSVYSLQLHRWIQRSLSSSSAHPRSPLCNCCLLEPKPIARERPYRSLSPTVGLFGPTSRPVDLGHRAAVTISSFQEARLSIFALRLFRIPRF